MGDSVRLDDLRREDPSIRGGAGLASVSGLKVLVLLFVLCLLVYSDVFVENGLAGFRGLVRGREVTTKGSVAQSACVVVLFMIGVHFLDAGII